MKSSILYRIAAVLLVLFAAGHTFGFSQVDPAPRVSALVASMQSIHFDMLGSQRSYWDLFLGLGYIVGLFYLFAAALAWQLGGLPAEALARMRLTTWAFAAVFAGVLALSTIYMFLVPIVFAAAITLCLIAAAWRAAK